jgi:hypothetical protein
MARPHHYRFAHQALPAILLSPRARFEELARPGRLDAALAEWWAWVGDQEAEANRLPRDGLHGEFTDITGSPALLVTLPAAAEPVEAAFAVATPLQPADERRYFTLELAVQGLQPGLMTMIGEWRPGSHLNLGPGPTPDAAAFLASLARILGRAR